LADKFEVAAAAAAAADDDDDIKMSDPRRSMSKLHLLRSAMDLLYNSRRTTSVQQIRIKL